MLPVTNEMRVAEAWKFLTYLTTKAEMQNATGASATTAVKKPVSTIDPAEKYLEKTQQPAARRDLIEKQKSDVDLGVFAKSNLTAKSWMQIDPVATEAIFAEMISAVNRGATSVAEALSTAAERVKKLELK
jgi:ABC-type glycerol-3-phosphate transport system substrate-binding protein